MMAPEERARLLLETAENPAFSRALTKISETSGIAPTSVAELYALWRGTIAPDTVSHWLTAMGLGAGAEGPPLFPVGQVAIVAPGNLFVATWTAMLEPWLCGNHVRVRASSGDAHGAHALADAIGHEALEVRSFPRDDNDGWRWLAADANAMAVYGGDDAVAAVTKIAANVGFRGAVRGHGHKVSVARLTAAQIRAKASEVGHDAWLADGRGCMSLRAVVCPDVERFSAADADALVALGQRWPRGELSLQTLGARRQFIEHARVVEGLDGAMRVYESDDTAVVVDETHRSNIQLSDLGPGGRLLVVLRDGVIGPDLRGFLASDVAGLGDIGKLQAPVIWRDPDGYRVGRVFLRH